MDRFARDLQDVYSDWLPKSIDRRDLLELTKLPHVAFFTFGESLPVIDHGTADPGGLGYAYANLTALIAKNIQDIEVFMEARDKYVRSAARQQIEPGKRSGYAKIFISYHKNGVEWVKRLEIALRPYVKSRNMLISYHELPEVSERFHYIKPGSMWENETQTNIQRTLQSDLQNAYRNYLNEIASSTVAVLLVSPEYLASDFILDGEFPGMLRVFGRRGLRITWIAVQPSLVEATTINSFQAAYDPSKPLSALRKADLNRALVEIAKRISEISGRAY